MRAAPGRHAVPRGDAPAPRAPLAAEASPDALGMPRLPQHAGVREVRPGERNMTREGPAIVSLVRRLAECPADFLAEPRIGSAGQVHVDAVVSDLARDLGGDPLTPE